MRTLFAAALCFILSFGCKTDHRTSQPGGQKTHTLLLPQKHYLASHGYRDTLIVLDIDTPCTGCRDWNDSLDTFGLHPIHIAKNDLGFVRLRKDAACFEVAACDHNVICSIPDNLWLWAIGPVKNADFSAGIAYIIKVKDNAGKFWKGYLSYTVLDKKGGW